MRSVQFEMGPSPGPVTPPFRALAVALPSHSGNSSDALRLAFLWEAAQDAANPLDLGHKSVLP